jgi:uncharacterized glyoxalase superfamily protein PhnB
MTFKKLTPNVMVEDVERTITFYKDMLDFNVLATVPEQAPFDWAMLAKDDVTLMVQSRASLGGEIAALADAPIAASLTFYTDITGLLDWYERLKGKVEIVQDLHTTFYNTQEFAFRDCNGYILAFSEPVNRA